jgi:hypothetical protein
MSGSNFSDKSAGVSWRSTSLGLWSGVPRTYLDFQSFPAALALVGGGSSLMTFTGLNGRAQIAVSYDGALWSKTDLN